MNSREIVIKTLKFDYPERVARDVWIIPAARKKYGEELDSLLNSMEWDIYYNGAKDPDALHYAYEEGTYTDPWGSVWQNVIPGILGTVVGFPLNNWSALAHYKPPIHLLNEDLFKGVGENLEKNKHKFRLFSLGSLFHRMCWLRDQQFLLIDILEEPPELLTLRDMVMEFLLKRLELALNYDYDAISIMDDWGSQNQLFIPPEYWRRLFKPSYQEIITRIKKAGKFVFFHSDGYIIDIIGDLIELGVDALNCQVAIMGIEELGSRFRGKITFWGEIDRQHLLPNGTPEQIEQEIINSLEHLGSPAGGYIFQAEIGSDVPITTVRHLFNLWEQYAYYYKNKTDSLKKPDPMEEDNQ